MPQSNQTYGLLGSVWEFSKKINTAVSDSIIDKFAHDNVYMQSNSIFEKIIKLIGKIGIGLSFIGFITAILLCLSPESAAIHVLITASGVGIYFYPLVIFGPIILGMTLQIVSCMLFNFTSRVSQLYNFEKYNNIENAKTLCKLVAERIEFLNSRITLLKTTHRQSEHEPIKLLEQELEHLEGLLEDYTPNVTRRELLAAAFHKACENLLINDNTLSSNDQKLIEKWQYSVSHNNITQLLQSSTEVNGLRESIIKEANKNSIFRDLDEYNYNELIHNLDNISLDKDAEDANNLSASISELLSEKQYQSSAKNEYSYEDIYQQLLKHKESNSLEDFISGFIDILPETTSNEIKALIKEDNLKKIAKTIRKISSKKDLPEQRTYTYPRTRIAYIAYLVSDMLTFGILSFCIGLVSATMEKLGMNFSKNKLFDIKSITSALKEANNTSHTLLSGLNSKAVNNQSNTAVYLLRGLEYAEAQGKEITQQLAKKTASDSISQRLEQNNCRLEMNDFHNNMQPIVSKTIKKLKQESLLRENREILDYFTSYNECKNPKIIQECRSLYRDLNRLSKLAILQDYKEQLAMINTHVLDHDSTQRLASLAQNIADTGKNISNRNSVDKLADKLANKLLDKRTIVKSKDIYGLQIALIEKIDNLTEDLANSINTSIAAADTYLKTNEEALSNLDTAKEVHKVLEQTLQNRKIELYEKIENIKALVLGNSNEYISELVYDFHNNLDKILMHVSFLPLKETLDKINKLEENLESALHEKHQLALKQIVELKEVQKSINQLTKNKGVSDSSKQNAKITELYSRSEKLRMNIKENTIVRTNKSPKPKKKRH